MKINEYEIKNKNLKKIAETLSDYGYNADYKNNSGEGDWYIGIYNNNCEAIYICSHNGFGEEVMECFINECDKGKDIHYESGRYSNNVIYVKIGYEETFTEKELEFLCEGGM